MLKIIPADLKAAVDSGRLLILSPFPEKIRHVTAKTAMVRNRVVADMASVVFVPHAAAGSKMESLCREILSSGKPLYTFDHPANAVLLQAGAKIVSANTDWKQILKEG
jgi:predicted Rossmann fold nucleotide-binding protein DprA/Smf involved in DNA uptake